MLTIIKKILIQKISKQKFIPLSDEFSEKLVLGWNIGVGNYFDIRYSNFSKLECILKGINCSNYKNLFKYTLGYYEGETRKMMFFKFNLRDNEKKISIHYQRKKVNEILTKRYGVKNLNRISHKDFLLSLKNSKISVGAFGWGEVCYIEFEAIKMGAAVLFPNMNNIETWPNIYKDRITYLSYDYNINNLLDKINELLDDNDLRNTLVRNSQKVCKSVYDNEGFDYLINFLKKIKN